MFNGTKQSSVGWDGAGLPEAPSAPVERRFAWIEYFAKQRRGAS